MKKLSLHLITSFSALSCAQLHHVQVGQIDNRAGKVAVPFEIMVSETGVSTEEIGQAARALERGGNHAASNFAGIVSLFQIGPRTGNPVYSPRYAEKLVYLVYEKCASGRVTSLMSVRETRKYPIISGEIVKITGVCIKDRMPANEPLPPQEDDQDYLFDQDPIASFKGLNK